MQAATKGTLGKIAAVYYGWLVTINGQPNEVAQRLAAGHPELVIVSAYTEQPLMNNLPPAVQTLFRENNTLIAMYVATNYGQRPLTELRAELATSLETADAIFLDEVVAQFDAQTTAYYRALAMEIRAAGKRVIANPGVAALDEEIMNVADFVMLEHQWARFATECPWFATYSPERFMGISSNEPQAQLELEAFVDLQKAIDDTRRGWTLGIGWHYSCEHYIDLPPWYATYIQMVRQLHEEI